MVKGAPEMVAWEMLTTTVPLLVIDKVCVAVLPTATSPKLIVIVLADRMPEPLVTGVPGPVFAALV